VSNVLSYLVPELENFKISPKMVQLFIPPIRWKGDPKGHIGVYDTFFYVVSGECCVIIDNESFILSQGELAFLPKGKMRTYSNMSSDITLYEINFEAEINGQNWYDKLMLEDGNYSVKTESADEIKALFENSVRYELNKNLIYDVLFCSNLMNIIRIFIFEKFKANNSASSFKKVIDYMKNNLKKTVKISELAELAYMQETYFIKKFKKALGYSPITYLNKMRIYKAMTYLAEGSLTLSEIGHKVGIYDSSYFSKIFKTHCGITPGEYRHIFSKNPESLQ
jgi:AraC-like DNA-binding protein